MGVFTVQVPPLAATFLGHYLGINFLLMEKIRQKEKSKIKILKKK
jgi:hypothetical protein